MYDIEDRINQLKFKECENILVGDILHYALNETRNFKNGLKDITYIFLKTALHQTYSIDVRGAGKTIALFSSSYSERDDHFIAFKNVTSLIDNGILIETGKENISLTNLKYLYLLFFWNNTLKKEVKKFGKRMFCLRCLFQAFTDYYYVESQIIEKHIRPVNLLVYCDVMPVDCFFVQKFRNANHQTVTLQHGTFALSVNAWAYERSKSDYFLVDSKASEVDARKVNCKAKTMIVGSPFQFNRKTIVISGQYKSDKIGIIMNSSNDPYEDNISMICIVQEYCKRNKKKMYIKLHPSNNLEDYEKIIDYTVVLKVYSSDISIEDFANLIDIAIISKSTVFKTMISFDKPAILFVRDGYDYNVFSNTDNIKFRNLYQLDVLIKKIENDFKREMQNLNDYFNVVGNIRDKYQKALKEIGI